MNNISFIFMLENSFYSEGTIKSRGYKMNRPNLKWQMDRITLSSSTKEARRTTYLEEDN